MQISHTIHSMHKCNLFQTAHSYQREALPKGWSRSARRAACIFTRSESAPDQLRNVLEHSSTPNKE